MGIVTWVRIYTQVNGTRCLVLNSSLFAGSWALDKKHGSGQYLYFSKGKVYSGEWIEDVAKCGELREMTESDRSSGELPGLSSSPLALLAASPAFASSSSTIFGTNTTFHAKIPALKLANPETVLEEAIAAARDSTTVSVSAQSSLSALGLDTHSQYSSSHSHAGLHALYNIDAATLDLSNDEVAQLTAAFRLGDVHAVGYMPCNIHALLEVLSALGIHANMEDARALLSDLQEQQREFNADSSAGGSEDGITGDGIAFPVFAACLARLRD